MRKCRQYLLENEGDGWKIATTTMMHDVAMRIQIAVVEPTKRPERIFQEEAAEIATSMAPYTWYPQRAGRVRPDHSTGPGTAASRTP